MSDFHPLWLNAASLRHLEDLDQRQTLIREGAARRFRLFRDPFLAPARPVGSS